MPNLNKSPIPLVATWAMAFTGLAIAYFSIAEMFRSPSSEPWASQGRPEISLPVNENSAAESNPLAQQQGKPEMPSEVKPAQPTSFEASEKTAPKKGDEAPVLVNPPPQSQAPAPSRSQAPAQAPAVEERETQGVPFRGAETRHPPYVVPEKDSGVYPPGF
jgi:hypothetical protein